MKTIGTIKENGWVSTIREAVDGRVFFIANADIDADGANGQHGAKAAYMVGDKGSEALANGGMKMVNGRVVCAQSWARDIVILGPDNQPMVFQGGVIASTTWYRHRDRKVSDPPAYLDSATVPYIVLPPLAIQGVKGIVRGCKARVTWRGKSIDAVVGDKGPRTKIGELSIAAAERLGIPSSPRKGGISGQEVTYEFWPGVPAVVDGFIYELQAA